MKPNEPVSPTSKQNAPENTDLVTVSPDRAAVAASVIEIRELHLQIHEAARSSLGSAIRIGELLTEQKAKLKHGEWQAWVESHLLFSVRTARNYLRIFDNREKLKTETVSVLTEAYKFLSQPKEATDRPSDFDTTQPPEGFIPGPGLALVGEGGGWIVAIVPSAEHQGFYYVTVLSPSGTGDDGGWMDFNKRPIRSDGIDLLSLRCVPTAELRWSERAAEPWSYNKLAYSTAAEALADRWAS